MLQLHATCCSDLPSHACVKQGLSGRNSLNYPAAQLASVIAMGPLLTKTLLTQRHHHHGGGEGVGDRVLYVATVMIIEPLAFMRCMRMHAIMHASNADNLEILRGARAAGGGNLEIARCFLESCHTHTFFILSIKAVRFQPVPPCAAVPKK